MAVLLFTLAAVFLFLAIYPFALYPLTLHAVRRNRRRPVTPEAGTAPGSYAICVCAYNEEAVIAQKVENMLALKAVLPTLEVMVYVDAATDHTSQILKKYQDRIYLCDSAIRHGKTYGMNMLVSETTAEIVIFTDANVIFDVESMKNLPRYFADRQVGCVCGHLQYMNAGETVTAANGSLYWRLEEHIRQLESDTGSLIGADGSIYAIRRKLHRPPPEGIVDDMYVSMNILCDGYRVVSAPDILAYEDSVTSAKEEFRRKVRIACLAFSAHRVLWGRLGSLSAFNLYKYISHKLLRWFVIYWLALAVVFFEAGMAAAGQMKMGLAMALLSCAVLGLGSALKVKPVLQILDILSAFAGTGLGVLRSIRGKHFKTWAPAASIRSKREMAGL